MDRQDFRMDLQRAGHDTIVLRAAGEIDLCSSFTFREQLSRAIEGDATRLILDVSSVRFIDSSGLSVLVATARRLFLQSRELIVVCPEQRIRRVLATSGLDRLVPVYCGMNDALDAAAGQGEAVQALPT